MSGAILHYLAANWITVLMSAGWFAHGAIDYWLGKSDTIVANSLPEAIGQSVAKLWAKLFKKPNQPTLPGVK